MQGAFQGVSSQSTLKALPECSGTSLSPPVPPRTPEDVSGWLRVHLPRPLHPTLRQVPACLCSDQVPLGGQLCISGNQALHLTSVQVGSPEGSHRMQKSALCHSDFCSSLTLQIPVFLRNAHWKGNGSLALSGYLLNCGMTV